MASVILLAPAAPARASQVRIPLTIDYITLREALKRKLYTAPGGRAELWNGVNDCQFLYAENPEFSRATAGGAATVQLETANSLGLGVAMGSQCLNAVQWSGIVQALGVPYIAPGLQLKFHFTDLNVFDSAHQKARGRQPGLRSDQGLSDSAAQRFFLRPQSRRLSNWPR